MHQPITARYFKTYHLFSSHFEVIFSFCTCITHLPPLKTPDHLPQFHQQHWQCSHSSVLCTGYKPLCKQVHVDGKCTWLSVLHAHLTTLRRASGATSMSVRTGNMNPCLISHPQSSGTKQMSSRRSHSWTGKYILMKRNFAAEDVGCRCLQSVKKII